MDEISAKLVVPCYEIILIRVYSDSNLFVRASHYLSFSNPQFHFQLLTDRWQL
jgi:hypothetical protein